MATKARHYEKCSFLLFGHTASVHSLTNVAGTVCSGSSDHTIRTWDIKNVVCDRVLMKHEALVSCLQSWHDHRPHMLISGGQDDRLCIWNVKQSGDACAFQIPRAHNGQIHSIDIVDENCFVSSSSDMHVKQWDIRNLKQSVQETHTFDHLSNSSIFSGFMNPYHSLSVPSPSSNASATSSGDAHGVNSREHITSFVTSFGEPFSVSCGELAESTSKQVVFTGSRNGVLLAVELSTGEVLKHYTGHHSDIVSCTSIHHGSNYYLLSGSKDHTVRLFDVQSGECIYSFDSIHSGEITCLQFYKEKNDEGGDLVFYSGSRDGSIKEVTVSSQTVTRVFERIALSIFALHRNSYDGMLYCGSDENLVRAWRVTDDQS